MGGAAVAFYGTSALLLAMMRLPGRARTASTTNFVRELREGWRAFTEHTWVWLLTLWISLYFLVTYAPFFVLGPYMIGISTSLWIGAAWIVVTTAAVLCVPDVRNFRAPSTAPKVKVDQPVGQEI